MNKIKLIYDKQKEYGYIKCVNIYRDVCGEECGLFNMKITLIDFPCWNIDDCFEIIFEGISNLKMGDINNLFKVSLQIESISAYQYENAKYIVKESENDLFSFFCKNISV